MFSITGQLVLQGPANIKQIVTNLNSQLSNIKGTVVLDTAQAIANLKNLNRIIAATQTVSQQLTGVSNKAATGIKTTGDAAHQAQRPLSELTTGMKQFGFQSGVAFRRFLAWGTVTSIIFPLISGLKSGFVEAAKFEKQMIRVGQSMGLPLSTTRDLQDTITGLSISLGNSSESLSEIAKTLAQAGIAGKDLKYALTTLAKSELSPSFDDIKSSTEGLIAVMHQFNIKGEDLEKTFGAISNVSAKYAVESSDLIEAIRKTGGAWAASGGSLNELLASFTSVRQTTRESSSTIAVGIRTILSRIQRGSTIEYLHNLGIELRDLQGQFVGPYEAIRRLQEALNSIPSTSPVFSQVIEEVAGVRARSIGIPLIQQYIVSQKALQDAQEGTNKMEEDSIAAQKGLINQLSKLKEEFLALVRAVYNNDVFKTMASSAIWFAKTLLGVADTLKSLLPILLTLGTFKLAKMIGQLGPAFIKGATSRMPVYASGGGFVPGVGDKDTVRAMLTPGEYVVNKKTVGKLGIGTLDKINKYAAGGLVRGDKHFYGSPPSIKTLLEMEERQAAGVFPERTQSNNRSLWLSDVNQGGSLTSGQISEARLRARRTSLRTGDTSADITAAGIYKSNYGGSSPNKLPDFSGMGAGQKILMGKAKNVDEFTASITRLAKELHSGATITEGLTRAEGEMLDVRKTGTKIPSWGGPSPDGPPPPPPGGPPTKQRGFFGRKWDSLKSGKFGLMEAMAVGMIGGSVGETVGGKTGAGISGGASGLAMGAATGGMIGGVPGAIIGGVIGGLIGITTSLNKFDDELRKNRIQQSFTRLSTMIDSMTKSGKFDMTSIIRETIWSQKEANIRKEANASGGKNWIDIAVADIGDMLHGNFAVEGPRVRQARKKIVERGREEEYGSMNPIGTFNTNLITQLARSGQ
jgi:TP901 family phage tail tape measure protein